MQRGRCDAQSLAANHRPSPRLVLPSAHISRPPRVLPEAPYARPFSQCLTLLTIASAALARYSPRPHQCRRLVLAALRRSRAVRVLLAARCARQTRETLRARILALVMPSAPSPIRDSAPSSLPSPHRFAGPRCSIEVFELGPLRTRRTHVSFRF
jgi:hypothetical protein